MNLVGDPWIPVIFREGRSELICLKDAFDHGEAIRDLAATPPQRVALMRLLVCIAQAALDGPADEKDWENCKPRIAPAVLKYLERHFRAFELYAEADEGAFLQVPNLEPIENSVVEKLDFGLAAGNNAVLFDHEAGPEGRNFSHAWRALNLLTYQCFSAGGMIGVTRWKGVWTGKKPSGPGTSEHAPCLDGGPLHTILRGEDLTTTIHANLLSRKIVSQPSQKIDPQHSSLFLKWGRPVWEAMPSSASDPIAKELAGSYLGRLVPIARACRLTLSSAKITLCNGLSYPKFPESREPSTTVVLKKDGTPTYLSIDLEKHPWRELSSLISTSPKHREGRALVLSHLRPDRNGSIDLWTGGLVADKGKVIDVAEWSFTLPFSLIDDMALLTYQQGVDLSAAAAKSLWAAVSAYCDDIKLNEAKTRRKKNYKAAGVFWSQLDSRYSVLIETAGNPNKKIGDTWYREVRRAMFEAYDHTCPHETPRQIQAFAKGMQMLRLGKPEE